MVDQEVFNFKNTLIILIPEHIGKYTCINNYDESIPLQVVLMTLVFIFFLFIC